MSLFRKKRPDLRAPLVRRVRDLELASARLIRLGFAGDYHSAFHGRGIEFSQVREYMPGDDTRTIDWNVKQLRARRASCDDVMAVVARRK